MSGNSWFSDVRVTPLSPKVGSGEPFGRKRYTVAVAGIGIHQPSAARPGLPAVETVVPATRTRPFESTATAAGSNL
jgi:hypothetical protein